jgi:hypothetical protein
MQMIVPGVPVPMIVAVGMSMRVAVAAVIVIMIMAGAGVRMLVGMPMVMARRLIVVFVSDAAVMLVRVVRHGEIRSVKARTRHYGLDA